MNPETEEEAGKNHTRVARAIEMGFDQSNAPILKSTYASTIEAKNKEKFGIAEYVFHEPIVPYFFLLCSGGKTSPFSSKFLDIP